MDTEDDRARVTFINDTKTVDLVLSQENQDSPKREEWDKKIDYMLTMLGFLVGYGNIWRFPYICMKNGGGAFLIPYLLTILLLALPVYFLESALGQFSGKTMKDVWSYCPLFQGIGLGLEVIMIPASCQYTILVAWVLYYLYSAFHSPLPWSTCDNDWNTPNCFQVDGSANDRRLTNSTVISATMGISTGFVSTTQSLASSSSVINATKTLSAEEEFWQYKVLDLSSGLEEFVSLKGHLVLCHVLAWTIIYLCVINGIKSTGKVVYVTATLPYLLLIILLVNNLTLPGSLDGIIFFIKPDFHALSNIQVWLEAAVHVFYSLAIGWGLLISFSSYNKFNNNCLRDTYILTLAGEGTSVFGGFVIFSALGFMAHEAGVPVTEVAKSGPGLGFVAYPKAISQMPFPNLWGVLFFVAMVTLGLDSQFTMTEVSFIYIEECFPFMKKRKFVGRAGLSIIFMLIGLPLCTQAGFYVFQLSDWYIAAFSPLFITLLECMSIAWVYGAERFSQDVELMLGRGIPIYIRICISFISPALIFTLIVTTFVFYVPPTYGDYEYSDAAAAAGWLFSLLPAVPIISIGLMTVYKSSGKTVYQKFLHSLKPTNDWHPVNDKNGYLARNKDNGSSLVQKLLFNIGLRRE